MSAQCHHAWSLNSVEIHSSEHYWGQLINSALCIYSALHFTSLDSPRVCTALNSPRDCTAPGTAPVTARQPGTWHTASTQGGSTGCTVHNSTVHNCTVYNCTVHNCTVHNCTVHNCTVHDCTVNSCTVHKCTARSCSALNITPLHTCSL